MTDLISHVTLLVALFLCVSNTSEKATRATIEPSHSSVYRRLGDVTTTTIRDVITQSPPAGDSLN